MPKRKIRLLILHEFKLENNASETSNNINRAWGEGSTCDWTVQSFKDEEGRGRVFSLDNEQLQLLLSKSIVKVRENCLRHLASVLQ